MTTVWLSANTLRYPGGGGHLWVYLNWALGLRAAGCEVVWLEGVPPGAHPDDVGPLVEGLQRRLTPFGFEAAIALHDKGAPVRSAGAAVIDLDQAREAD